MAHLRHTAQAAQHQPLPSLAPPSSTCHQLMVIPFYPHSNLPWRCLAMHDAAYACPSLAAHPVVLRIDGQTSAFAGTLWRSGSLLVYQQQELGICTATPLWQLRGKLLWPSACQPTLCFHCCKVFGPKPCSQLLLSTLWVCTRIHMQCCTTSTIIWFVLTFPLGRWCCPFCHREA